MKTFLLFCILLGGFLLPLHAQQTLQLDAHASVVMPGTAESSGTEAAKAWYCALSGDDKTRGLVMTTLLPYAQMQLDSAGIATHYNDPEFIEAMVKGMLGKLPGVTLSARRKISQEKRKGYDFDLVKDSPDEQFPYKKLYMRVLFGGKDIYLLAVYLAENVTGEKEKDAFFQSFRIR